MKRTYAQEGITFEVESYRPGSVGATTSPNPTTAALRIRPVQVGGRDVKDSESLAVSLHVGEQDIAG